MNKTGNRRTHGMRQTRIYSIWTNLRTRTRRLTNKNYGGRGIKCEWGSFEEFYRDMAATYKDDLTIERINNDGNYSKENCKWIPLYDQQSNTQKSVKYLGETMSQAERRLGLGHGTIWERIRSGWTMERAFKETKYENRVYKH